MIAICPAAVAAQNTLQRVYEARRMGQHAELADAAENVAEFRLKAWRMLMKTETAANDKRGEDYDYAHGWLNPDDAA